MKDEPYKMNKNEIKHSWKKMSDTVRNAVIKRNMDILKNPESDDRAVGIATKNLILINAQNMILDDIQSTDNTITINIKEE